MPGTPFPGSPSASDGVGCPRLQSPLRPDGCGGGGGPTPASISPPASAPDFLVLDDSLHVRATYISGELVWQAEEARQ